MTETAPSGNKLEMEIDRLESLLSEAYRAGTMAVADHLTPMKIQEILLAGYESDTAYASRIIQSLTGET